MIWQDWVMSAVGFTFASAAWALALDPRTKVSRRRALLQLASLGACLPVHISFGMVLSPIAVGLNFVAWAVLIIKRGV